MKKLSIAAASALLIWAGGTYFVGNQMQSNIEKQIQKTNLIYADKGISYEIKSYEKSFFESKVEIEIKITDPLIASLFKDTFKPFIMQQTIEHGPLLFKNGFGLGLARMHKELKFSSLLKDDVKEEFLKVLKDDIDIVSDAKVNFMGNADYALTTSEINIKEEGTTLSMTPLTIKGQSSMKTLKGDGTIKLESFKIVNPERKLNIALNDIKIYVDMKEFIENALMLGDVEMSIADMLIEDPDEDIESLHTQFDFKVTTNKDSEKTLGSKAYAHIDFKDTKFPKEIPPLKEMDFSFSMERMGIKGLVAIQKVSEEMQKKQSELIAQLQSNPKNMEQAFEELGKLQQESLKTMLNSLQTLLVKDKTSIGYTFSIKTEDNEKSNLDTKVLYTGDIDFSKTLEEIIPYAQGKLLELLNADVAINLSKKHIELLPNAETLKQQISMGVMQGLVKDNNSSYSIDATLKYGELMVNDNNLTGLLIPLMMMSQQGNIR